MAKALTDVAALDAHMLTASYIEGVTPTQKDISVFKAIAEPGASFPHAQRWYTHIATFSATKIATLPGSFETLASSAAPPAAKAEKKEKPPKEEKAPKEPKEKKEKPPKEEKKKEAAPKEEKKKEEEKKEPSAEEVEKQKAKDLEKLKAKIIKEGCAVLTCLGSI